MPYLITDNGPHLRCPLESKQGEGVKNITRWGEYNTLALLFPEAPDTQGRVSTAGSGIPNSSRADSNATFLMPVWGQSAEAPLPLGQVGGPRYPSGQQMATTWIFLSFRLLTLAENCISGLSENSEWVGTWHSQQNWQGKGKVRAESIADGGTKGAQCAQSHTFIARKKSHPAFRRMQVLCPTVFALACLPTCHFLQGDFWPQTPIPNGQNLCLFFSDAPGPSTSSLRTACLINCWTH